MAQAFSHPNLLSGTRSGNAWAWPSGGSGVGGGYNKATGWQGELIADYGLVLDVGTNVDIALDVRAGYR